MASDNSRTPVAPRMIPWPWRALSALLLAVAAAVLLQLVAVPTGVRAVLVGALVIGTIALDVAVRTRYSDRGPQRSYLQIVASFVALLVIGTLLSLAAPLALVPGLAISVLVGVLAFGVLHWGQRQQMRHAQRSAAPQHAQDATHTAIAERGGDHHPDRDDRTDHR